MGDPRAAEDRPHRLPLADPPFHRTGGGIPVRTDRAGLRRGRRERCDRVRHPRRRAVLPRRRTVQLRCLPQGLRHQRPCARRSRVDRARRRYGASRTHAAIPGAARALPRSGRQFRRRPRHARTRHDHVRRILRVVPLAAGRDAQLEPCPARLKGRKMTEASIAETARRVEPAHGVSLGEAFRVWLRVAAMSFGGPAGQIAVMHRIIVDEKKWVGESRFLHALSYCMLLPGPEAHQLTIYIGWLMHRWPGAIVAGGLFVVPIVSIMALSYVYAAFGSVPAVAALFFGLKAAVLAIVLQAVHRVGSRALKSRPMLLLAALAFIGIFFIGVPFPLIVLAAGIVGFFGARSGSRAFQVGGDHGSGSKGVADSESLLGEELPEHAHPTVERALRVSAIWLSLWLLPVIAIVAVFGVDNTFSAIGGFFSKMAVVTFGGAYAVLAYMAQQAVETYGWLRPGEMLDGLGMAETTPGPLIMVVQFVGFLAAYRHPGMLPPMLAGTLGGLSATWCTFVPCFLWIGLGAPFIERLRDNKALTGALAGITAAVVGVILNLAIWFALHTWFRDTFPLRGYGVGFDMPVLTSLSPWALALSVAALVAILRFKAGTMQTLAASSVAGIVLYLAGLVAP